MALLFEEQDDRAEDEVTMWKREKWKYGTKVGQNRDGGQMQASAKIQIHRGTCDNVSE